MIPRPAPTGPMFQLPGQYPTSPLMALQTATSPVAPTSGGGIGGSNNGDSAAEMFLRKRVQELEAEVAMLRKGAGGKSQPMTAQPRELSVGQRMGLSSMSSGPANPAMARANRANNPNLRRKKDTKNEGPPR